MSLKEKLKTNCLSIGSWITLAHPTIPEIMSNSGFDWLTIDLEHSSISIRETEEMIRIIHLSNVDPLVRLTSNSSDLIKRVMDFGASGIIVPNITSLEEVEMSYQAMKYPPQGTRGVGLARAQKYGRGFSKYLDWQKEESVLIAQIENIKAIDNLEDIFSSGLIDAYMIGPYDLSASMGIPGNFDDKGFIEATEEIKRIAEEYSITSGLHIVEPVVDDIKQRVNEGYRFIAYSLDTRMLDVACKNGLEVFKEL